jgi:hypothetical protein
VVPGIVEDEVVASDNLFESKITITKLTKSQNAIYSSTQSTQDQFLSYDVQPSSLKATTSLFASQRKSSRIAVKTPEELYTNITTDSIELLDCFSRIDPTSFLSKHEKIKMNRSDVHFEKTKQVKRTNTDVLVDNSISIPNSKKTNYENSNSKQLKECYSVDEMIRFAKKNKFPKTYFLVNNKLNDFTTVLHFFESARIINLPNNSKLNDFNTVWICKICRVFKDAPLSRATNLNKHLRNMHEQKELKEWFNNYNKKINY